MNGYMEQLDAMVGLNSVKAEIKDIINANGNMNLCFEGNPGTGKTTVAKLYTSILNTFGIIDSDRMVEVCRNDLVGGSFEETSLKIKAVFEKALGGALFIDEAYLLVISDEDQLGKAGVDTLVTEMEQNEDKLVIILSGFKAEMDKFLKAFPELKGRMAKIIEFPDYSDEELMGIFEMMIKDKNLVIDKDEKKEAEKSIREMYNNNETFGNARTVQSLIEKLIQ